MVLRSGQGDFLDGLAFGEREHRRVATGKLRCQRVEPIGVEVVDHLSGPVFGGEGDLGEGRHVHGLSGPQHDLGSSPSDDRARSSSHDAEQLVALGACDLSRVNRRELGRRSFSLTRKSGHQTFRTLTPGCGT